MNNSDSQEHLSVLYLRKHGTAGGCRKGILLFYTPEYFDFEPQGRSGILQLAGMKYIFALLLRQFSDI